MPPDIHPSRPGYSVQMVAVLGNNHSEVYYLTWSLSPKFQGPLPFRNTIHPFSPEMHDLTLVLENIISLPGKVLRFDWKSCFESNLPHKEALMSSKPLFCGFTADSTSGRGRKRRLSWCRLSKCRCRCLSQCSFFPRLWQLLVHIYPTDGPACPRHTRLYPAVTPQSTFCCFCRYSVL